MKTKLSKRNIKILNRFSEDIVYKIRSPVINLSTFKPKLHSDDIEYYLHDFDEMQVENDKVYALAERLTNLAHPTYEDQFDKRWEYFYIPIRRSRKTIAVPIWIMEYEKEFFVTIQSFGRFHIKKGDKETEKFYLDVFTETLRFVPIIKKDESILQKIIPYDIRMGKIKGFYILKNLLSQYRKKTILENYEKHIEKNLQIKDISLNDYLNVAAICYKTVYQKETENLSNFEMYKKWADGRDGGMLSIKDWNSKKEFSEWYHSGEHAGSHPFEIVFSWHEHGIHLYPPNDSSPCYALRVTNYAYAYDLLKMISTLIKMQIPFEVGKLEIVLDFLAGETYFTVNEIDEHHFIYMPSKEYEQKYFPHIEWDEIKVVKWK